MISAWISKAHGFVNCVGLIDGTLFHLGFSPMLNREDYFTRKGNYEFKGLIICDAAAKITWVEMGWLRSVHDYWVWSNSDVYLSKNKYFNNKQYLLGDLAFSASSVMIPAFKRGRNFNLSDERKYFNTNLGLLKVQFQRLQGHQWVIQSKRDLDVILQVRMCACILHNLLIDHAIPQDWIDNSMELEEDEELDHPSEIAKQRDQILAYMLEIH